MKYVQKTIPYRERLVFCCHLEGEAGIISPGTSHGNTRLLPWRTSACTLQTKAHLHYPCACLCSSVYPHLLTSEWKQSRSTNGSNSSSPLDYNSAAYVSLSLNSFCSLMTRNFSANLSLLWKNVHFFLRARRGLLSGKTRPGKSLYKCNKVLNMWILEAKIRPHPLPLQEKKRQGFVGVLFQHR